MPRSGGLLCAPGQLPRGLSRLWATRRHFSWPDSLAFPSPVACAPAQTRPQPSLRPRGRGATRDGGSILCATDMTAQQREWPRRIERVLLLGTAGRTRTRAPGLPLPHLYMRSEHALPTAPPDDLRSMYAETIDDVCAALSRSSPPFGPRAAVRLGRDHVINQGLSAAACRGIVHLDLGSRSRCRIRTSLVRSEICSRVWPLCAEQ